jgi:hypothetical protein
MAGLGFNSDNLKVVGALIATLFTGAILVWWLIIVATKLGVKPEVDSAGNVVLDEFQRSKDILLVVLPLFTAALGYWVGTRGESAAKEDADKAKDQLDAVVDSADKGILADARRSHPEAFKK